MVVPEHTVDGRSLVALADVLVSAGGTMNREAAVLGTPVWSMFEGPLGGVDELLVREGRLRLLDDPDEIAFERKHADRAARRAARPGGPARLALPWVAERSRAGAARSPALEDARSTASSVLLRLAASKRRSPTPRGGAP